MKSDTSSLKLPTSKAQWEKVIALAPGKDRLPTTAENAARKTAVSISGGGYATVRDALTPKNTKASVDHSKNQPSWPSQCATTLKSSHISKRLEMAGKRE